MKDVMYRRGRGRDQDGALELRQKSRTNFIPLFDLRGDEIKDRILAALAIGPRRVSLFCEEWPARRDDLQCSAEYRQALLQLEADGKIEVLSKDGKNVCAVGSRRKLKGKPTLGEDYFVRLRMP